MYRHVRQFESYRIEARQLARLDAELRAATPAAPPRSRRRSFRLAPARPCAT